MNTPSTTKGKCDAVLVITPRIRCDVHFYTTTATRTTWDNTTTNNAPASTPATTARCEDSLSHDFPDATLMQQWFQRFRNFSPFVLSSLMISTLPFYFYLFAFIFFTWLLLLLP